MIHIVTDGLYFKTTDVRINSNLSTGPVPPAICAEVIAPPAPVTRVLTPEEVAAEVEEP